jgi:prophage regulatory protein
MKTSVTEKAKHATLIRGQAVLNRTGISRSAKYALMASGDFPASVKLSAKAVAWVDTEVDDWIDARIAARVVTA